MAELTVDMTYGNALYSAAKDINKVELIAEEADVLVKLFQEEKQLYDFVRTPAVSPVEKKEVIDRIFTGRVCDELKNFICILLDKGRISHFPGIIRYYIALKYSEECVSDGVLFSTEQLSSDQMAKFEAETGKLLREKVSLRNEIDKKLIGGVKILIDGKVIDASLKKGLEDMGMIIKS